MEAREKLRAIINQIDMLSIEEKNLIVESVSVEDFKKGTVLLRQGQITSRCYLVLEGCIREYTNVNGEEKTTGFFIEGEGTAQYIGGGKNMVSDYSLECLEKCSLMIGTESMEDHIRKLVPRLDRLIQQVSKEKLEQKRSEMTKFVHSSPEERYTHLMNTKPNLFHRAPHHQIASYLGMQPQSLSRIRKRIFNNEMGN